MDFLGDPEAPIIDAYVSSLEAEVAQLRGHVIESLREPWDTNKHGAAPEEGCDHVEYTLQDLPHNTN